MLLRNVEFHNYSVDKINREFDELDQIFQVPSFIEFYRQQEAKRKEVYTF